MRQTAEFFRVVLSWDAASRIRRHRVSPNADDSRQSSALGSAIVCCIELHASLAEGTAFARVSGP